MIKPFLYVIVFCLVMVGVAFAGGEKAPERNSQPIKVKSNELFADNNNKSATFTGKVSARQGDMTIYCDKLVVGYSVKGQDVERVEAFGNVRIVQGSRQAIAGHAIYENKAGKITLDTLPKVYQGENVVSGKVITYFVDEQKSVVTGGTDVRVEAVIHPRDKGTDGNAQP